MQTTNLRQLLYSQSPSIEQSQMQSQQLQQSLRVQQQLTQTEMKLSQQKSENAKLQCDIFDLQKRIRELEQEKKEFDGKQKLREQQVAEMEEQVKIATEDAQEYRNKVEQLEMQKFELGEEIDNLTAKLKEWQENYSLLYNKFSERVDSEVQEVVKNHQQQMDEAELVKQQISHMYTDQIESMTNQINQLEQRNRELQDKVVTQELQLQDLQAYIKDNEQLINQAYQLVRQEKTGDKPINEDIAREQIEQALQYQKKLAEIEDKIFEQNEQFAKINNLMLKMQKIFEKAFLDYKKSNVQVTIPNAKTVNVLEEQLTQKKVENIKLNEEIKTLKQQLARFTIVQEGVQNQIARTQRLPMSTVNITGNSQNPSVYGSKINMQ